MRAIDADKLCTDLMERWDIADKQKEELVKQVMADIVTPIVVSQPTIEPERKKGKWVPLQLSMAHPPYQCSCCFGNAPMVETGCLVNRYLEALLTSYCPNCGADMREDQDDQSKR